MAPDPIRFALTQDIGQDRLVAFLNHHTSLLAEPTRSFELTYLDSFDWRLFEHGSVIELETAKSRSALQWRALQNGACYGRIAGNLQPRFAWDLPNGPLRSRLESIVEMRALLPVARVRRVVQAFRLLNKNDKMVLRIELWEDSYPDDKSGERRQPSRQICFIPVKGYAGPLRKISRLVEKEFRLQQCKQDPFLVALAAGGHEAGTYRSKQKFAIEPSMPAALALRRILRQLLDAMEANEPGLVEEIDSEFLHDFRVAVRRTRVALTQFKGVLCQNGTERFANDFAWLGQVTSTPRDLDVYYLSFDHYKESVGADHRGDLEPLHGFLGRKKEAAYTALVTHLRGTRYAMLKRDWRTFLSADSNAGAVGARGGEPILELANRRIWRVYRRIIAEGLAINDDTPAEALHDLRKTCKKLRYLIEFFQDLYPAAQIKAVVKTMKVLQDNLGAFQDLEVQRDALMHFSRDMMAEGGTPAETFVAMGVLIDGLHRRQDQARAEFHARFDAFNTKENRATCKALFAPDTGTVDKTDEDHSLLQH